MRGPAFVNCSAFKTQTYAAKDAVPVMVTLFGVVGDVLVVENLHGQVVQVVGRLPRLVRRQVQRAALGVGVGDDVVRLKRGARIKPRLW
jgi:hypothetical protein